MSKFIEVEMLDYDKKMSVNTNYVIEYVPNDYGKGSILLIDNYNLEDNKAHLVAVKETYEEVKSKIKNTEKVEEKL